MERLCESLLEAERHTVEGQALLDEQRAHVEELTRHGKDAREAKRRKVEQGRAG